MKKVFLALLMCMVTASSFAQLKVNSINPKLNWDDDFGLGVGVTLGFTDQHKLVPSFNYTFAGSGITVISLDVDYHYECEVGSNFVLYPIGGIFISHASVKGGDSTSNFGGTVGGGARYDINEKFGVFFEPKYSFTNGGGNLYLSLGVAIGL